jgi:arginase
MKKPPQRVALIGAPTDVGAGRRGASMGPEALRVAGIVPALERLHIEVHDYGNLAGPPNIDRKREGGHRHLREVAVWCNSVRDTTAAALEAGEMPIVIGGDHSLSIGSIAAVSRHSERTGKPLTILWLDAHADFNVDETSPTGNIHGMAVAVIAGHGPEELLALGHRRPIVPADRIIQVGVRSVDAIEKKLVVDGGLVVYDMRQIDELGMRAVAERALAAAARHGGHMHVSFDVDFLDPSIAPGVPTTVPGGPTYREAQLVMEMIHDSGLMGSLDIMELNPAFDVHNRTATLAVELVESLFGEQILARAPGHSGRYTL